MGDGITGMSDLIIVTLLAAGLLKLISHNGGITYIIEQLTRHVVKGSRGAQVCVSVLVGLVNVCTANNTIAILFIRDYFIEFTKILKIIYYFCILFWLV